MNMSMNTMDIGIWIIGCIDDCLFQMYLQCIYLNDMKN